MKAVYSNLHLHHAKAAPFKELIQDLIRTPEVLGLDNYDQHLNTSRLQHSLNVAYYAYLISKNMDVNHKDLVRGALLHDLFLYDWREVNASAQEHVHMHPRVALETARKITDVSDVMEDVIVNHMWPLGNTKPKTKEAWIVQASDKLCTLLEISHQSIQALKHPQLSGLMLSLLFVLR
jgi:uncharacterized protein